MLTAINKLMFPEINGSKVHTMNLDLDLEKLIVMLNHTARVNGTEDYYGLEEMRNYFERCENFDLSNDLILVKVDEEIVGYQRVTWHEIPLENKFIYQAMGAVHPDWLNQGIGTAMLNWAENRLLDISKNHPSDKRKVFQAYTYEMVDVRVNFLKNNGYSPERYFYLMERKDLSVLPPVTIPEGIILRSPQDEADWRKAYNCLNDAFKDHWGFAEITETDIQRMLNNPYQRADLSQLAWKDDRVIGTVLVFVDTEENENLNKSRAWTEEITVRKEYRGQGIAKAMIYSAMHAVKDTGLKTAALGVDTNNPNGALGLYERCGYETLCTSITFEKPLIN